MIDFRKIKPSPDDDTLMLLIANRAKEFSERPKMQTYMDLLVVHDTVGLRLNDFLAAPDLDFTHDIFGIARHLNRKTGELQDCFLPRFATQPMEG